METACSLRMYKVRICSSSLVFDLLNQVASHFGNIGNKLELEFYKEYECVTDSGV